MSTSIPALQQSVATAPGAVLNLARPPAPQRVEGTMTVNPMTGAVTLSLFPVAPQATPTPMPPFPPPTVPRPPRRLPARDIPVEQGSVVVDRMPGVGREGTDRIWLRADAVRFTPVEVALADHDGAPLRGGFPLVPTDNGFEARGLSLVAPEHGASMEVWVYAAAGANPVLRRADHLRLNVQHVS